MPKLSCLLIAVFWVAIYPDAVGAVAVAGDSVGASTPKLDTTYTWQAEDRSIVGMWTSGASAKVLDDADADSGAWLQFQAKAPGEFIEFTLPDVLPGRYTLEIRYKAHAQRGSCRIEVGNADGSERQLLKKALAIYKKVYILV